MACIALLLDGRLRLYPEGELSLPRRPPFGPVLAPGPAVVVDLELTPESPDCIRVFDAWYATGAPLSAAVDDGAGTRVAGMFRCVGLDKSIGLQVTRAWSPPLWRNDGHGRRVPYRPTPRWQPIARDVHRYQIAANRYAFVGAEAFAFGSIVAADRVPERPVGGNA